MQCDTVRSSYLYDYKQCSFNCVELGFFDNLNKIQINLPYVDAIHWLNQCNDITIRRFIAYKSPKCEINVVVAVWVSDVVYSCGIL